MNQRKVYDLDADTSGGRRPIDAGWSKKKKRIVGVSAAVLAISAAAGGAWTLYINTAPGLPTTADEAVATIGSARWDNLDADRKQQYMEETWRLTRDLPRERRRELFEDEKTRDAMRDAWRERMDEMIRDFARGEEMEWGPPGGRRDRDGDEDAERPQRRERPELTAEERAERMEAMRNAMNQRMNEQLSSGNAQSGALRTEMFQRMRQGGGPGGPGGRRGR